MKRVIVVGVALLLSGCGGGRSVLAPATVPAISAAPQNVRITEIPVPGESPASPQPVSNNGENITVDAAGDVYFRSLAPQTLDYPVLYLNGAFTFTKPPDVTVTGKFGPSLASASGGKLIKVAGNRVLWDAWYGDGIPNDTYAVVYAGAAGTAPQSLFPIDISETASWASANGDLWVGGIDRGFQYSLELYPAGVSSSLAAPLNTSKPVALTGDGNGGAWLALDDGTVMRVSRSLQTIASFHTDVVAGGMVRSADGSLWLTDQKNNAVEHMTSTGNVTTYALPSPNAGPAGIVFASDGALWFTETNADKIGRITTAGDITEYPLTLSAFPSGISESDSNAHSIWVRTSDSLVHIAL